MIVVHRHLMGWDRGGGSFDPSSPWSWVELGLCIAVLVMLGVPFVRGYIEYRKEEKKRKAHEGKERGEAGTGGAER